MNETHPLPDLAQQFRCLLKVVTGALCAERRGGWLGVPMALLAWIRERRERREAAAMMEQFKGLIEQFLVLLEAHRAGTLTADHAPEGCEAVEGEPAFEVKEISHRGGRGGPRRPGQAAVRCGLERDDGRAEETAAAFGHHDWFPAFAGMTAKIRRYASPRMTGVWTRPRPVTFRLRNRIGSPGSLFSNRSGR